MMSFLKVQTAEGIYPFAKNHQQGERLTRSAVCTSSPLRSLRPRWTAFLTILQIPWHISAYYLQAHNRIGAA